ncbi:penicillin-binding transpeptidase domain-containing protein [Micromonospora sp. WMMD964]|uniref:peptidoglycan D,D-transpeptidase FtsI family protein n=1 Tax=Micromonospora sp. WMMD964 TaxID=3016091 RepID=UPI00249A56DF|nr:penicillin-binding transpeptidase domain-containing protein [Micromonospora sp. WMMD964]WFF00579.1 penicillin-binding transpeptidase domain-containing protein [Micromonospora sp. WMMD964]
MPPRSDEPRRDPKGARRGSSREARPADDEPRTGEPGIGGISGARAYTPRGRTVREDRGTAARGGGAEQRRTPRSTRSGDPFRPALQVLDGGRAAARSGRRDAPAAGRGGVVRTVSPRTPRAPGVDEPAPRRRTTPRAPRRADRPVARRPSRKPPRPPKLADSRLRLRLGTALALTLFASIGIRLVFLQAVDAPAYAGGGTADRTRTVELPAPRGAIYDTTGAPLARSVEARYVSVDPTEVEDPPGTAKALSPLLGIPASKLVELMKPRKLENGVESRFAYLARGVEIATAKQVQALELPGIGVHRDERRDVPGGDLAANLIGFTSQDMAGLEGLEARFDDVLAGQDGKRVYEAGLGDLAAPIPGGYSRTIPAKPGSSLALTIDRDLQFRTQQILSAGMAQAPGGTGAAVIIEIPSGAVLAQASNPTYSAAKPLPSDPVAREDAATSFVVDPGSIHKAITFGAALQEGVITPDTTLPIANAIKKGDTWFPDTHPANGKRMSIPGMLAYSSNVGTITIADKLGRDRLIDYQKRFGLGKPTGEGMPGEASGRLLPADEWSESSEGSVPIGHSVDATPLQMAAAYAAIANNGTYVQPHLVKEVIGPDGKRTPTPAPVTRSVLSPQNAAALRTMLEAVTTVDNATGLAAAVPGYRVAGKTGTGWRLVDGKKQPGEVSSFIGMAPAENPQYVIAVFAYAPKSNGAAIAGPAFRDMMQFTLRHYRVPPSTGGSAPKFTVYPR